MRRLTIDEMLELGWAWQGPMRIEDEAGVHYELRVLELPDFFLAAQRYEEVTAELKPALRAYLQSYLDRGENPPLPTLDHWLFSVGALARRRPQTGPRPQRVAVA